MPDESIFEDNPHLSRAERDLLNAELVQASGIEGTDPEQMEILSRIAAADHAREEEAAELEQALHPPPSLAPREAPEPQGLTEEAYVAREVAVTRATYGGPRKPDDKMTLEERLQRTERYARWRWKEFHTIGPDGKRGVASL